MSGAQADARPLLGFWRALWSQPKPLFVTLDGGQFLDLPSKLWTAGVTRRSLYLDHADDEVRRVGPWLAEIETNEELRRLAAVVGDRLAVVGWLCPAGVDALFKHLRRMNEAIVARLSDQGEEKRERALRYGEAFDEEVADWRYERVQFRHFDPRALGQVLPALNRDQIAKLLGPAQTMLVPAEDGGEPFVLTPDAAAKIPQGPLVIDIEQSKQITAMRQARTRERLLAYLKDAAPRESASYGEKLGNLLGYALHTGTTYGVQSEYALGLWAYMLLTSRGDFTQDRTVRELMIAGVPMSADERVERLFDARLAAMARAG